jgi:orotate phosphoribosyltransferase
MERGFDKAARARLLDIIRTKSFRRGDFTLASGKKSDIFLDLKPSMLDAEGAHLIALALLDKLGDDRTKLVGGLEMGAVPLVAAVAATSWAAGRPVGACFVRKQVKDHGTKKLVEGEVPQGARIVMLEDVATTGGSVMKAIEAVRTERGCLVDRVITVVDRNEGAAENLAAAGIKLDAVYNRTDFIP